MARTLVVGATGHLGQEIVRALRGQGHDVHALVRPATRADPGKMKTLAAAGATIHEGDLRDPGSLVQACRAVDNVVCAIGSFQIGDEGGLVEAVREAGVKRFIPSDFGLDPRAAGPGASALFDAKAAVHRSVQEAGIPYTFVHTNGFFSYWVFSLGDLTRLGGQLPPEEVNVYGDGDVKGSFASVPDIAAVTVRALHDPEMEDQEVRITANEATQRELIDLWQWTSGRAVKTAGVSASDMEALIVGSTAPEQEMMVVLTQLHRSMWIRGDAVKRPTTSREASEAYPELTFQTPGEALAGLL
jgi:uncharacterized protein YbjT (DUF2867 family)